MLFMWATKNRTCAVVLEIAAVILREISFRLPLTVTSIRSVADKVREVNAKWATILGKYYTTKVGAAKDGTTVTAISSASWLSNKSLSSAFVWTGNATRLKITDSTKGSCHYANSQGHGSPTCIYACRDFDSAGLPRVSYDRTCTQNELVSCVFSWCIEQSSVMTLSWKWSVCSWQGERQVVENKGVNRNRQKSVTGYLL